MDFLKALFESGALTWDEFSSKVSEQGFKIADLSKGAYTSTKKYNDDLKSKDDVISDLNTQISTRDTDLSGLKEQLEKAGTANNQDLEDMKARLATLQTTYEKDKSEYESKLGKQKYEFAVKEFANSKKFTSNAAKRDFINAMLKEDLKLSDDSILGAEDFVTKYSTTDADAFLVEEPGKKDPPKFIDPPAPKPAGDDNPFMSAFSFTGVRPHDTK